MPDRPAYARARRFSIRTAALLLGLAGLAGPALPLLAQEKRAISVEWIFSDAGAEPTRLPPFAWTSDGDVLLLDTRQPKDVRSFERVTSTGGRKPAVDRKGALSSLKSLLGETGVPDSLAWPESLDRAGRRAVYTFADDLFLLDLTASRFERLTRTAEAESIPRLSPDGRRLAFVRGHDLFLLDLATRGESRLTSDGSSSVLNGALSWVYWEEIFDHEDAGFWWSPDGSAIAFLRSDESAVSLVSFADFKPVVPRVVTQRYPKAGGANPSVKLGVVDVASGAVAWMDPETAPYEYVVAVEWVPDNKRVAVQTENRLQTRLDLYFVDRASGKPTRVLSETDAGWVNTHDLEFLEGGKGFLWSSERDGYTHLYRYAEDGTLLNAVTKGPWSVRGPGGFTTAPLGAIAAVDDARGLVYFTALEKSPVERQLYRVHLDGSGQERLSREDGVHQVSFSLDHLHYLDVHSSHATLPSLSLRAADGSLVATPAPPRVELVAGFDLQYPELLTVPAADGTPLQARILKPKGFDPSRRYPVILDVYGGPGAPTGPRRVGRKPVVQPAAARGRLRGRQHRQPQRHRRELGARDLGRAPPVERRRAGRPRGRGRLAEVAALGRPGARRGLGLERRRHVHARGPHAVEGVQGRHRRGPGHGLALLRHQVHRGLHEAAGRKPRRLRAHLARVAGEGPPRAAAAGLRNLRRQRASPEQLGLRGRGDQGRHCLRHDGLPDAQARDRGSPGPHPPVQQDAGVLEAAALARAVDRSR